MAKESIRKYLSKTNVDVAQAVNGVEAIGEVISATITTARFVGESNMVRVTHTGAAVYITFGDSGVATPSGAISERSIRLPATTVETVYYILASGDYIRGSAAVAHAEVIKV